MTRRSLLIALFALLLISAGFAETSHADKAQMDMLVPDVPYMRKTPRTLIYSRAQLKYGLERDDYLSRWVDQPLFVDPALREANAPSSSISYSSFRRIQEVVKSYGLDGIGFFPQTVGRAQAFELTTRNGLNDFHLLTEFVGGETKPSRAEVLQMALDNPHSQRINGKVVIASYLADNQTPEYWERELNSLRQQFGDTFIFLPDLYRFAGKSSSYWIDKYRNNTITSQDIAEIKADLRKWLSVTDGLYTALVTQSRYPNRKFDEDFYRNFMVRMYKSVLAEPQFKDKYFGLSAMAGHENPTRVGATFSSDATKTLRHSLSAALDAQPDLINMAEWDEQNENTSVRPTVYNGTSTQRILRYYTGLQRGKNFGPLPGDDVNTPNLIISYRKLLVLGEELDIELLNIPDTDKSTFYTARLTLQDLQGNTVYQSPTQQFQHNQIRDNTVTIPSETLAKYQVLRPKLEIEENGQKSTFEDGLHYIELRPSWNWDYKWVKQPLRDLLKPMKSTFLVSEPNADGARQVTAEFQTNEPLAYVQMLDNDNVVYIAPPKDDPIGDNWRENDKQYVISISWESLHTLTDPLILDGNITLKNATGKWRLPNSADRTSRDPFAITNRITPPEGQTLSLKGLKSSHWQARFFLTVPRAQIEQALLEVSIPGIYVGQIPVRKIIENAAIGIPGPYGFNMVISRYLRQAQMPRHLQAQGVQFSTLIWPDLPNSVLHLQAIGKSGRIYRSAPVRLGQTSGNNENVSVYSETQGHPVTIKVLSDRIPDIQYDFDPARGSILTTKAGRPFWGIFGGDFIQATERGGGESNDGSPFIRKDYPFNVTKGAPDWVKTEAGENALQFDGKGTYITLPQGVIPRLGSWTIEMDVRPDTIDGKQFLIGNRTYYMGSLVFSIENGEVTANFHGQYSGIKSAATGVHVPANKWSHLKISYDQKHLVVTVNGKSSEPLIFEGPGIFDTLSIVGGFKDDWFHGKIKSLRIRHSAR